MSAEPYAAAVHGGEPSKPANKLQRRWAVVPILLAAGLFLEAVFAGAMLSGAGWAQAAHRATALLLIGSTVIAGLVAVVTLRSVAHGLGFALILLGLAAVVVLQTVLGAATAHGGNLLWLHVPIGVALVGLAGQAIAAARRLGNRPPS